MQFFDLGREEGRKFRRGRGTALTAGLCCRFILSRQRRIFREDDHRACEDSRLKKFAIATALPTPSPSLSSHRLFVDRSTSLWRLRTVHTESFTMLSLRSDAVRRRPDLTKMCWSCALKHHLSPTSIRSLRNRISLPKQPTPRALFSSQSRVIPFFL